MLSPSLLAMCHLRCSVIAFGMGHRPKNTGTTVDIPAFMIYNCCRTSETQRTEITMRSITAFAIGALVTLAANAVSACPDYSQWGRESYNASGNQLYQPQFFNVVAGGENYLQNCRHINPRTDRGPGYFTTAPDFTFDLRGMRGYELHISVVSQCDSALLINTGSANWYYDDDDNGNLDPKITLTYPSDGYLDIWVGTYDGQYCDATLRLETF